MAPVRRLGGNSWRAQRRSQGGFVVARIVIALATSTSVTAAVAGPLAYQAHQALVRGERTPTSPSSVVAPPNPKVLGITTVPGNVVTTTSTQPTTTVAPAVSAPKVSAPTMPPTSIPTPSRAAPTIPAPTMPVPTMPDPSRAFPTPTIPPTATTLVQPHAVEFNCGEHDNPVT